jgi:hypothetical protein
VSVGTARITTQMPMLASKCAAALWIVVLDRATSGVVDSRMPNGYTADACTAGVMTRLVTTLLAAYPTGIYVVNTLWDQTSCGCARPTVSQEWGDALAPLGFAPTWPDGSTLNAMNTAQQGMTGVGAQGLSKGGAWQAQTTLADDTATQTPGAWFQVVSGVTGRLVAGTAGYHLVNFDEAVAQRYGGDGPGGFLVNGVKYPSPAYSAGVAQPPAGRGGFQLLFLKNGQVVQGEMIWTNTDVAATNATAYTHLNDWLRSVAPQGYTTLLRNVGVAKPATTTSASDPSLWGAIGVAANGGAFDAIVNLAAGKNITMAIPSYAWTNYTTGPMPLDRTVGPIVVSDDTTPGQDPRYASFLFRRMHDGFALEPAQVATSDSDGASPFALQTLLTQPRTAWPEATTGEKGAFTEWSHLLCGCADARAHYLDDSVGGWDFLLRVSPNESGVSFNGADFETERLRLQNELGWVSDVWTMQNRTLQMQSSILGPSSGSLLSAWSEVTTALHDNDSINAANDTSNLTNAAVSAVVLGTAATPDFAVLGQTKRAHTNLGRAHLFFDKSNGVVIAGWFSSMEFGWPLEGPTDDSAVGVSGMADKLGLITAQGQAAVAMEFREILSDGGLLAAAGDSLRTAPIGSAWSWDASKYQSAADDQKKRIKAGFYALLLSAYYKVVNKYDDRNSSGTAASLVASGHPNAALVVPSPLPFIGWAGSYDGSYRWGAYLTRIGKSGTNPPSEALMQDIEAQGVTLSEILRTWTLIHEENGVQTVQW